MIIVDFHAVSIATLFSQKGVESNEELMRHMILNSLRSFNVKYKAKYGNMVIACDQSSWRRNYFPQYKASRRDSRSKDDKDWNFIFNTISKIRDEIDQNLPWKVVNVSGCEADDIIGTLCEETQEFGKNEPIMIISGDKDFLQLQKYSNVAQFSPLTKKELKEKDPHNFLFEHICRGDSSDGVPNILSPDNTFVDSLRQTPITQKKLSLWKDNDLKSVLDSESYRNFQRNQKLIDLTETPKELKQKILNTFENAQTKNNVLTYFIQKRLKNLIECAGEFR